MESKKQKISIKELSKKFIPTIKKIFSYLKRSDFNSKIKLIGEIVVLVLLLCLLKLPFSIARDIIINAFFSVKISSTLLMNTIYLLFGLPYILLVIYLFVKTIVTRYENIEMKENTNTSNTQAEETNEVKDDVPLINKEVFLNVEETSQINQNKVEENELSSMINNTNSITDLAPNNENTENSNNT